MVSLPEKLRHSRSGTSSSPSLSASMALSAAMIYLTLVFYDSTYYLLDYQFDAVARHDEQRIVDRHGKAVIMSAEAETSEIIRRRLFEWHGMPAYASKTVT